MVVDATVDHGNPDSRTIKSKLLARDIVHDRGDFIIEGCFVRTVWAYVSNVRMVFQKREQLYRNLISSPVDMIEGKLQFAAPGCDHLKMVCLRRLVELNDHVDSAVRVHRKVHHVRRDLVRRSKRSRNNKRERGKQH